MQPVPSLYHPDDNFAVYMPRIAEFTDLGQRAGMSPSANDKRRTAIVIVDGQVDFCHPDGTLYVGGAEADTQRLVEWMYANSEDITTIVASLDSHLPFQIFYRGWWGYEDGTHPEPFTMIMLNSNNETVDHNGRRVRALIDPVWSIQYVKALKTNAQKDLMIWPYHTMIGTKGHMLMPSISEAIAYHSAARMSQPIFVNKGTVPQTEHFGIFSAEVMYAKNPASGLNTQILDLLGSHDLIYVGGQAKSHCVLETMLQFVKYFRNQPDVLKKVRFLEDATSSVQHPAVDFEAIANAALQDMAKLGIQLVRTTDSIS